MQVSVQRASPPQYYTVDPILLPSGNPFKCHEDVSDTRPGQGSIFSTNHDVRTCCSFAPFLKKSQTTAVVYVQLQRCTLHSRIPGSKVALVFWFLCCVVRNIYIFPAVQDCLSSSDTFCKTNKTKTAPKKLMREKRGAQKLAHGCDLKRQHQLLELP